MSESSAARSAIAPRAVVGGALMGIANLVPGISGGTMLLASGVYTHFIRAIAEVSTFKFRARALSVLFWIGVPAALTILLLAGPVKHLVETQTWIMYALFIGLTLGGIPVVWRLVHGVTPGLLVGTLLGFAAMYALAQMGPGEGTQSSFLLLFLAGLAGASAMILPGVSGAYLLMALGQYSNILGAVSELKQGVKGMLAGEGTDLLFEALGVVVPVGLGVIAGITIVSNLLKWALDRQRSATLGVLLGLLLGSFLKLWPFQRPVAEGSKSMLSYAPTGSQMAIAAALVLLGLAITLGIDRFGNRKESAAL